MASNSFGNILRMTSFGESHGPALGVVVDGVPPGLALREEDFLPELARRRPGQSGLTTSRRESDTPHILSGTFRGMTTGMPIAVIVENENARSSDYDDLEHSPRPGHADETYAAKYGHRDHRGGGRSSGRETLCRVIAGVIARKILPETCRITGHALQIGPHRAQSFDAAVIETNRLRSADLEVARLMEEYVEGLKEAGDSTGGLVEVRVDAPPASLGDPVFGKLKARLADAMLSVGAVTGFAYGAGFSTATLRGTEYVADRRHFGGILGGISTGEPLRFEVSVKPTSSIGDVARKGRHDPCIVPRVIPVLEAMTAFVLADLLLVHRSLGR
ncbi:MAG TPA: chorismate synthase [Planctomycetes bacterium]|nr:chorismate synthase [Planctomycetota bacterium]